MFFGDQDYNVPPCCSQKYFRFLFEHLSKHTDTTIFVLPDFTLDRLIERVMVHMPICNMTIAVPTLDDNAVKQLCTSLHTSHTKVMPDGKLERMHRCETLNIIMPPIEFKSEHPYGTLTQHLKKYEPRVKVFKADIASTIILCERDDRSVVFYGDIAQGVSFGKTELRMMHVSTNPAIIKEIRTVLKIHSHHKVSM